MVSLDFLEKRRHFVNSKTINQNYYALGLRLKNCFFVALESCFHVIKWVDSGH